MSTEQKERNNLNNVPPDMDIRIQRLLLQLLAEQEGVVATYTLTTKDGEELEFSTKDYIDPKNPRARIPSRRE